MRNPFKKPWSLPSAVAVLVVIQLSVLAAFLVHWTTKPPDPPANPKKHRGPESVVIGGVRRPSTDLQPLDLDPDRQKRGREEIAEPDPGQTPPIPKDANPMVASVAEALETGNHPERLSSLIAAPPFDRAAYEADPAAYLKVVEPGRVWQSAQPGPGVPRLKSLSPLYAEIPQGETVSLRVQAVPGAPVTFTSFDLGAFQNRLTSITVQADEKGVAVARFTGTPGTYNLVHILAASPLASGQQRYVVNIRLKERGT